MSRRLLSGSVPTPDAAFLPTLTDEVERGTPARLVE